MGTGPGIAGFRGRSKELTQRVITGLIGGSTIVGLVGWGGLLGIEVLVAVISFFMAIEFGRMTLHSKNSKDAKQKRVVLILAVLACHFVSAFFPPVTLVELGLVFIGVFSFYLLTAGRHTEDGMRLHIQELSFTVFGVLYVGLLPLLLPMLRSQEGEIPHLTVLFFLMIWATDTGAYFTGLTLGRTKLFPVISPKKSVEGLMGGVALTVVVAFVFRNAFQLNWSDLATILTAVFVSLSSQLGDLCESFLKRAFQQKDSGSILPGHGGFLDRFDGFLVSLPVLLACVFLFSLVAP